MHEYELNMYWKSVVNTMQEGLMIVDTDGTIVAVNPALGRMTGFAETEMIGHKCAVLNCDLFDASTHDCGTAWCRLFHSGVMALRRCTLQRKDGRRIDTLKNATLLYDNRGRTIGAVETITDISEVIEKDNQIEAFRQTLRSENGFEGMIGVSAAMRRNFDLMANAALSDAPVMIFGESGTGKELVASAIHNLGNRRNKPFVKINCAALQESLLESELFGHVKGAYTGAYKDREGRFEAAHTGDIFLDEIGDIPIVTQVKLLRVLEEKVVERVGDSRPMPVDVRIVSATNRNLEEMVARGHFRQDLFFRINVIPIQLPPLRERTEDIPLLAEFFFEKIRLKNARRIQGIAPQTMHILMQHAWPGNIRELKSVFEYAFVTCNDTHIQPEHLPASVLNGAGEHLCRTLEPTRTAMSLGQFPAARDNSDYKRRELLEALRACGGNQSVAARFLGVSRGTIWNRMKKYGIAATRAFGETGTPPVR